MLPLVSQSQNWTSRKLNEQSSALPVYNTNMKTEFPAYVRTMTPWKHRTSRVTGSPTKNYVRYPLSHTVYEHDVKVNTKDFDIPYKVYKEKSFRSSTILRQIPIMRRHLDSFGGRIFSIPVKTKSVPVHTGRFLSQNERLEAEHEMMQRVRGQKRRREAMMHRWGWKNFDLYGQEVTRIERYNIREEVEKLKELVLPLEAREIYTGRGIRLPSRHHTKSPHKPVRPQTGEDIFPLLSTGLQQSRTHNAKAASALMRSFHLSEAPTLTPKPINVWEARLQSQQTNRQLPTNLIVKSVAIPGIQQNQSPKPSSTSPSRNNFRETPSTAQRVEETIPTPMNFLQTVKMHESVEKIEVVKPGEELEKAQVHSSIITISETPTDRPRSLAAPSASPEIYAPNPLSPMPLVHHDIISVNEKNALLNQYNAIKGNTGKVSFDEMINLSNVNLTKNQVLYLSYLHDVTVQKNSFGQQELVAFACLAKIIENLRGPSSESFAEINFESLPELIAQYSELFTSVDRTSRGEIGMTALIQILSTTLQKQINLSGSKLLKDILHTLNKESNEEISKLEFLAHVPYFIYLEGVV